MLTGPIDIVTQWMCFVLARRGTDCTDSLGLDEFRYVMDYFVTTCLHSFFCYSLDTGAHPIIRATSQRCSQIIDVTFPHCLSSLVSGELPNHVFFSIHWLPIGSGFVACCLDCYVTLRIIADWTGTCAIRAQQLDPPHGRGIAGWVRCATPE
jgi:hypothetical protein